MRPTDGTSITGDSSAPPSCLTRPAASSSFGTPTYMAQKGGASMPSGRAITPATATSPVRLNIVYGCGAPSNGAGVQPITDV